MVTIDYENYCWILYLAKAQIPQSSEVILMFVLKGHRIQLFKRSSGPKFKGLSENQ